MTKVGDCRAWAPSIKILATHITLLDGFKLSCPVTPSFAHAAGQDNRTSGQGVCSRWELLLEILDWAFVFETHKFCLILRFLWETSEFSVTQKTEKRGNFSLFHFSFFLYSPNATQHRSTATHSRSIVANNFTFLVLWTIQFWKQNFLGEKPEVLLCCHILNTVTVKTTQVKSPLTYFSLIRDRGLCFLNRRIFFFSKMSSFIASNKWFFLILNICFYLLIFFHSLHQHLPPWAPLEWDSPSTLKI